MFDTRLTELNHNMKVALEAIAKHEIRFGEQEARLKSLEDSKMIDNTRKETVSEMAKFGWLAAKVIFIIGAAVGGLTGCGWVFKAMFGG